MNGSWKTIDHAPCKPTRGAGEGKGGEPYRAVELPAVDAKVERLVHLALPPREALRVRRIDD